MVPNHDLILLILKCHQGKIVLHLGCCIAAFKMTARRDLSSIYPARNVSGPGPTRRRDPKRQWKLCRLFHSNARMLHISDRRQFTKLDFGELVFQSLDPGAQFLGHSPIFLVKKRLCPR
jgi:hypothetical protein